MNNYDPFNYNKATVKQETIRNPYAYILPEKLLNTFNIKIDDDIDPETFIVYFNDAIDRINIDLDINLPYLLDPAIKVGNLNNVIYNAQYKGLPRKYLTKLMIPLLSMMYKENDETYDEAQIYENRYMEFIRDNGVNIKTAIDKKYIPIGEETVQSIDYVNNDLIWYGDSGDGF